VLGKREEACLDDAIAVHANPRRLAECHCVGRESRTGSSLAAEDRGHEIGPHPEHLCRFGAHEALEA
jgi:hypothetical protein